MTFWKFLWKNSKWLLFIHLPICIVLLIIPFWNPIQPYVEIGFDATWKYFIYYGIVGGSTIMGWLQPILKYRKLVKSGWFKRFPEG